jgi:ketosteroid isomerase-like protein
MPGLTPEDEAAEIQETNERFYRAVETRDLDAMDAVWLHADHVRCVHPGWGLLSGWDTVRQSWAAIFKDSRELRFTLSDVQIQVEGALAWVTATENILSQLQGNISVTAVLATNVYERRGTRWRMVLHHASHILTGEPEAEGGSA